MFNLHCELTLLKQHQAKDWDEYRKERLESIGSDAKEDFLSWRPRFGVYAGSFNPLHAGHMNIIAKAEQLFDKVIVSQGINPAKAMPAPIESIGNRQVEMFTGFLTDYLKKKQQHADVTLVRGLRNGDDLAYEVNQLRFLQDFDPNIKVVFFHCDREYEYLSSTMLRFIKTADPELANRKYGV